MIQSANLAVTILLLSSASIVSAQESPELPAKLGLAMAEKILFENNFSVIVARYGVESSRAARLAATYTPNPTLTTGAEQIKTDRRLRNYAADSSTASNPTYTFRIDQVLETGGKKGIRTEAAEMQLRASEAQVLDTLRLQTLQMKLFFYSGLLARQNVKSAREVLDSISKTEELMLSQSKRGNIPEADLIKFQANKIQFERDAATAQLSYDQAIRDLINILGAKPSASGAKNSLETPPVLELIGELVVPESDFDLNDLRMRSSERPDVIAAQRALDAAEKNVELSNAQRKVNVTVGGEYQRVGGDNTVGLVLSVPLPLYNNHKADISQAEAQRNAAISQHRQVKAQAATDVDKAWQAYSANKRIVQLYAAQTLDKARESLEIVQKSYDRKSASLLELLDAQRTYKQILLAAHQAQYDLLVSIAQLESSSGQRK